MDAALAGDEISLANAISRWSYTVTQRYQHLLDKSTPHVLNRWISFIVIAFIYAVRVYFLQGFYIVSYGLGIYILNLLIGFLSPQVDPEIHDISDGPTLPTRGSDEFRPFVRRLPEFKFWCVRRLVVSFISLLELFWLFYLIISRVSDHGLLIHTHTHVDELWIWNCVWLKFCG